MVAPFSPTRSQRAVVHDHDGAIWASQPTATATDLSRRHTQEPLAVVIAMRYLSFETEFGGLVVRLQIGL